MVMNAVSAGERHAEHWMAVRAYPLGLPLSQSTVVASRMVVAEKSVLDMGQREQVVVVRVGAERLASNSGLACSKSCNAWAGGVARENAGSLL
jgi:hypothetical protein